MLPEPPSFTRQQEMVLGANSSTPDEKQKPSAVGLMSDACVKFPPSLPGWRSVAVNSIEKIKCDKITSYLAVAKRP